MRGSSNTAVVCDTTAYLPTEIVEREEIELVSLYVNFGDEQRRESDLSDYDAFYERLKTAEEMPTTSQPSVGDFLATYEPILAEGREIVSIHISGSLSGTYESALRAKQQLEADGKGGERLHVYDSSTTCGGLALVALAASAAAAAGEDGPGVLRRAERAREELKIFFAVDTLEYLRRGGRIGGASALIGTTLKIKPILTFEREITPIERVRTTRRAIERLHDYARQRLEAGADAWVVQHIQAPDRAAKLVESCREIFGHDPIFVSEMGPVIGAHAGPGVLGIGSIPSGLLARS